MPVALADVIQKIGLMEAVPAVSEELVRNKQAEFLTAYKDLMGLQVPHSLAADYGHVLVAFRRAGTLTGTLTGAMSNVVPDVAPPLRAFALGSMSHALAQYYAFKKRLNPGLGAYAPPGASGSSLKMTLLWLALGAAGLYWLYRKYFREAPPQES